MTYPNITAFRLPYDTDGSGVLAYSSNPSPVALYLSDAQRGYINDESDNEFVSLQSDIDYVAFIFPVLMNISGVFVSVASQFDFTGAVYTSTDTTNGQDGTWVQALASLPAPAGSNNNTWPTVDNYRKTITSLPLSGIKGVRFTSSNASHNLYLRNLHLYGAPVTTPDIQFCDTSGTPLTPDAFNFSDVAINTYGTLQFKLKNNSAQTAGTVKVAVQIPTDTLPSLVNQFKLSLDNSTWLSEVEFASVAPGLTATIYFKRTTPNNAILGPFVGRLGVTVNTWS